MAIQGSRFGGIDAALGTNFEARLGRPPATDTGAERAGSPPRTANRAQITPSEGRSRSGVIIGSGGNVAPKSSSNASSSVTNRPEVQKEGKGLLGKLLDKFKPNISNPSGEWAAAGADYGFTYNIGHANLIKKMQPQLKEDGVAIAQKLGDYTETILSDLKEMDKSQLKNITSCDDLKAHTKEHRLHRLETLVPHMFENSGEKISQMAPPVQRQVINALQGMAPEQRQAIKTMGQLYTAANLQSGEEEQTSEVKPKETSTTDKPQESARSSSSVKVPTSGDFHNVMREIKNDFPNVVTILNKAVADRNNAQVFKNDMAEAVKDILHKCNKNPEMLSRLQKADDWSSFVQLLREARQ